MIRQAVPEDVDALDAFLSQYAATSMFLRGNLTAHGVGETAHTHGTTYFIHADAEGFRGVAGVTNGGYLMCQAPNAPQGFWHSVANAVTGRKIAGMTGEPAQIEQLSAALGLRADDFAIKDTQPLYQVMIEIVAAPRDGLTLCKPEPLDVPMLVEWFADHHADTGMPVPEALGIKGLAQGFVEKPDAWILRDADQPVAMTALNARVHDVVQVGGVYVPPMLRGHGYGGAAVALHLRSLYKRGIKCAILFAASIFAARAYEAIGFIRIGSYEIALLPAPRLIGATI
ncbi:hypothetical protein C1J03_04095 [Sulfitobacter sp. SK012]|uniref:GNAT family N-acetyltransferase n=1 Tax=Sulfitobacter sp. SK012 TaxID=1389005 RepID=UPI000E0A0B46|nr:GNAT family N-acetyltransferase [Sulfitobacter sp. SK012]AXI45288.1 hypothetical protein C1J03_04095 [Sulfitobacter sp. SK012]